MSRSEPQRPAERAQAIPEERVHAALRRAAQLQSEATERLEREARLRIRSAHPVEDGGFLREEVETAAVEAGISPEYIRQALLEQDALGEYAEDLPLWVDRVSATMLRSRQRSLELARISSAEPAAVLEAMQRVLPAHPYGMTLVDSLGGLPLEGGVLVFRLPDVTAFSTNITPFAYAAKAVDLLQLHVSLRAVPVGDRPGCEITFRGDLRTGVRRNVWAGLGLSGMGAGVGTVISGAIAVGTAAAFPLALAGVALGTGLAGYASVFGYGAVYRHYLRKLLAELNTLLKVIDTNARTGGAFRPPPPPSSTGDDGSTAVTSSF